MSDLPSKKAKVLGESFRVRHLGQAGTLDYRAYFQRDSDGKLVSPWHDIPLMASSEEKIFNMIVEIPRWSNAKLEISKKQFLNPIVQVKTSRMISNC